MDRIFVVAKAVVAAVAGAVIAALAGVDWWQVILAAVASGAPTYTVPNRKPHRRR